MILTKIGYKDNQYNCKMTKIPITAPYLDESESAAVRRVLNSGWITQGPEVKQFESEFAQYVGAFYACAVSSCTTGLHLALKSLGIGENDKVITASHSFIATANAINYERSIPVFADIEKESLNICPKSIEKLIDPKVKAIIVVHQIGIPARIEEIKSIADKYNLYLIEDAACAAGSEVLTQDSWEKIGKPHGDIAVFSFHPRKIITTGDGGMITTNNPNIDQKLRLLRQHGMNIPDTMRYNSSNYIQEEYIELGYNYRMTDIQAAIGRVQLQKMGSILEKRRTLANNYKEMFSNLNNIFIYDENNRTRTNFQSFAIRLPSNRLQTEVVNYLYNKNISVKKGITCIHKEKAYSSIYFEQKSLINSEEAQLKTVILPLYPGMNADDQLLIANSFKEIVSD